VPDLVVRKRPHFPIDYLVCQWKRRDGPSKESKGSTKKSNGTPCIDLLVQATNLQFGVEVHLMIAHRVRTLAGCDIYPPNVSRLSS
jgi:hypothetical protein